MIFTVRGHIIDFDEEIEGLLIHRLSNKINPFEILMLTDCIIQFPNFLYIFSLLTVSFLKINLWIKFIVPSVLYFFEQMMINFRFENGGIKLLKYPLMIYFRYDIFIMLAVFITYFFFLGWWTFLIIPAYFLTNFISLFLLNSQERKYYKSKLFRTVGLYEIYKFHAFLLAYKYYATKYQLTTDFAATDEEIKNQDWLKFYSFMRDNWGQMEEYFSDKGKKCWRAYLHIEK
jgi:hypothetical protein